MWNGDKTETAVLTVELGWDLAAIQVIWFNNANLYLDQQCRARYT